MSNVTPQEARAIAKEAFIYGFPAVEGYKTLYKQAVKSGTRNFRAPFNAIGHSADVATPDDTWVVTVNSDTPFSFIWMDLRAEPLVITMPKIEPERYYSVQLIDLYTHNFAYLGTRPFGNSGGNFVIAGPGWDGPQPDGVRAVISCETQIAYALFRTQLYNPDDLDNVKKVQAGYRVQTLSQFLGTPAPDAAPAIEWPKPSEGMTESASLFEYLNFLLQFCPTHATEEELMKRFATLGIGSGLSFDAESLPPDVRKAVADGLADVEPAMAEIMKRVNAGKLTSGDVFGTREFLQNNYLFRFAGAKLGLYGNSREEAFYTGYFVDAEGKPLDASTGNYALRFEKGELPPADAFWSLTMYDGKTQFLVANPINRYLINSTTLDSFVYGDDGSLTIHLQKDSPGAEQEPNWLPAPDGPFYAILRFYLPKPEVIAGEWLPPAVQKVK
jgi:hypothetical protein